MVKRLLLADDDANVRESIAALLEAFSHGDTGFQYEVVPVASVDQAMRVAGMERFDLVLLDLTMPGVGGLDAIGNLQAVQPDVPIVIITGLMDEEIHQRARNEGARMVITKPFDIHHLLEVVRTLVGGPPP